MQARWLTAALVVGISMAFGAWADPATVNPEDLANLWGTLQGTNLVDVPEYGQATGGFLRYVAVPDGNSFASGMPGKSAADPAAAAVQFMSAQKGAFGAPAGYVGYTPQRVRESSQRVFVRLQQTYDGVPVFGAQATVEVDGDRNVLCVIADVMRDTQSLDDGSLSLVPAISPPEAQQVAIDAMKMDYPSHNFLASSPDLAIYDPQVVGNLGEQRLIWRVVVESLDSALIKDALFVDAHGGQVVLRYPLVVQARDRKVYDSANGYADPGTLMRSELDGPTGIADVDAAFDYFGDTYDFYSTENGRDSIDGLGMTIEGTVRFCHWYYGCPMQNAFWDGSRMYFGEGFVADDVVAHELTHGVTDYASNLVYLNESGAINEAFSDIWGEFVDLTNGAGTDTPAVRWLMGEDTPFGAIRSMKNPPAFSNWFYDTGSLPMPDTYKGTGWYSGIDDNGGVHHNMGVGMKLAYLLTDGDTFNGYTIDPMGISAVADLFYKVQADLIPSSADYYDLGVALMRATDDLSLSSADTENIRRALYAVKIFDLSGDPLRGFRATPSFGNPSVDLTWILPTYGLGDDANRVTIVRKQAGFPANAGDGTVLQTSYLGTGYVDNGVTVGTEYFYGLFPDDSANNEALFARVTAGDPTPDYLSEALSSGSPMSYKQIVYQPVVSLAAAENSGKPESYVNYSNYLGTIADGAAFGNALPVAKEDIVRIPLMEQGHVVLPSVLPTLDKDLSTPSSDRPIPFFGRYLYQFALSAKGFITADLEYRAQQTYDKALTDAIPTLTNHFSDSRISFLFADLDPGSGGEVWARYTDDRVAITFENVPEYGMLQGNTVQCELFYSGMVRCTYLSINTSDTILGVSDGNGVPPALNSDLLGLPETPAFRLNPISNYHVSAGQTVEFVAEAISDTVPVDFALVDLPSGLSSADWDRVDDTSYRFTWESGAFSSPTYSFQVEATAGAYTASQWVNIFVSDRGIDPVVTGVTIAPTETLDDQLIVRTSQDFAASFTTDPPGSFVVLYWYNNGAFVPALTNTLLVPSQATHVGEYWHCGVLPVLEFSYGVPSLLGAVGTSPVVRVLADADTNGDAKVNAVDVQQVVNAALGLDVPGATDLDGDGATSAVDVQRVLNAALSGE